MILFGNKNYKGFGLIESALLILIVSSLTIVAIETYKINNNIDRKIIKNIKKKHQLNNIRFLNTEERLNKIYEAMKIFFAHNHRLPCPEDINGNEDFTSGCVNITNNITFSNIKYNNIPYKTLGLTEEFSKDEWGNNFKYLIDINFTKSSSGSNNGGFISTQTLYTIQSSDFLKITSPSLTDIIDVQLSNVTINPNDGLTSNERPAASYIFAIISSGPDQSFATENNDDDIIFNIDSDDILLFKNKQELIRDTKLKYFPCGKNDMKIRFNTAGSLGSCANNSEIDFGNITPNLENSADCPCNNLIKLLRKCGNYGIWKNPTLQSADCSPN